MCTECTYISKLFLLTMDPLYALGNSLQRGYRKKAFCEFRIPLENPGYALQICAYPGPPLAIP